jgi:peptidoglycan/LPS O-acetylase OafA/YrhL
MNAPVSEAAIANPETRKIESYPLFDWLRFALASFVVFDHFGFEPTVLMSGALAVKVFFALSGWLIGGILLRTTVTELPRFFFNRATRIWIPYAIAIVLLYAVAAAIEGMNFFWFKYLILDVTFTHQIFTFFPAAAFELPLNGSGNQFWSISVEEQFYLAAPLLMLFLPRGKSILLWAPIAIVTTLLDWNAAAVSLGLCAAILARDHDLFAKPFAKIIAIVAAVGLGLAMLAGSGTYLVGPLYAVSVVIAASWPGKRSAIALIAGGLSYPLYLNHWIANFGANFIDKHIFPLGPATVIWGGYVLAVAGALAHYLVIDRAIQTQRNRWYSDRVGKALGTIAYALVACGLLAGTLMMLFGPSAPEMASFR